MSSNTEQSEDVNGNDCGSTNENCENAYLTQIQEVSGNIKIGDTKKIINNQKTYQTTSEYISSFTPHLIAHKEFLRHQILYSLEHTLKISPRLVYTALHFAQSKEIIVSASNGSKHIEGDYIKAGGDVLRGNGFHSTKIYGAPTNPADDLINVKLVLSNGRKIKMCLIKGENKLRDLKKVAKKMIANVKMENATFHEKDDKDDLVELTDCQPLSDLATIYVTMDIIKEAIEKNKVKKDIEKNTVKKGIVKMTTGKKDV
uniref:Uncharacterized protein n=1 Tax=Strigamia maritima TaxID=126957 RepID=T1IWY4_STRMM